MKLLKQIFFALVAWLILGFWPNSAHQFDKSGVSFFSVPSLFGALEENALLYHADPGGMLAQYRQSYEQSTFLEPLLWSHAVGSGRPVQPFDGYNFGYLDPIQIFWKYFVSNNFVRFVSLSHLTYIFVLCFIAVLVFSSFIKQPALLVLTPLCLYKSSPSALYPNISLYIQQTIVLLLLTHILTKLKEPNASESLSHLIWVGIGVLLLSSASFSILPFCVYIAVGFCYLLIPARATRRVLVGYCAGAFFTLVSSMPALLPGKIFQGLSTNSEILYIGYGVQGKAALAALNNFMGIQGFGFLIAGVALAHFAFRSTRHRVTLFMTVMTAALLGLLGTLDRLQLLVGLNIQASNAHLPLLNFALVALFVIALESICSAQKLSPRVSAVSSAVITLGFILFLHRDDLHPGKAGVIYIEKFASPQPSQWREHPTNLGINGSFFRIASLHLQDVASPRSLIPISGENVNNFYVYPLSAGYIGLSEATGSASLTLKNYSDFLDVVNYGYAWGSMQHPRHKYWTLYRDQMSNGLITHSETQYGIMAQQKRNNLLLWNTNSPLLKYTGIKWVVSSTEIHDESIKLTFEFDQPLNLGREYRLAHRNKKLFVYELKEPLGKAWFASRVLYLDDTQADVLNQFRPQATHPRTAYLNKSEPARHSSPDATIQSYTEGKNAMTVRFTSPSSSLMIISTPWFPGWQAEIGNRKVPIVRVNHAFMGVWTEPGESILKLTFAPPIIGWSLVLGVIGFIANLLLWACSRLRSHPTRHIIAR